MIFIQKLGGWIPMVCAGGAILAGCSGSKMSSLPDVSSTATRQTLAQPMLTPHSSRCTPFAASFDQFVACQRADGTLRAFANPQISWRVRYFVRYMKMPCEEAPTVQEGYVFHAVIDDLNADADLSSAERTSIRAAMFDGNERCP
jgi:hypothetical protein